VDELSVSSNGSTWVKLRSAVALTGAPLTFSILERIDVGETKPRRKRIGDGDGLSVSSNGSTWVKPPGKEIVHELLNNFQYPRTDRRG